MLTYLSYPMTGYAQHNRPRGEMMTALLRWEGYEIFAPHEILHGDGTHENASYSHQDYIDADIREGLSKCGRIALDAGWEHSRGCRLELEYALLNKLEICYAVYMEGIDRSPWGDVTHRVAKLMSTDGRVLPE